MSASHDSDLPEPDPMTIDPANLGSVDPLSVEGIFLVALSKTGTEREVFLASQCADLPQRQRVEALLVAYERAGTFLQQPAVASEPTPIGQYLAPCELPGTLGRLGPYEILEEIGRGGMGVVFRAHDPKLQRIVAVKALAPELARLPSARQRFLREARAAAAISHPHVVTIFAVEGTEEASLGTERTTLPYLVMECIVGQTLHDKIKRVGALKVEEIVRISRQIAEGLTAAHKRGLIHRDIKPANILLENGVERVRITDFGLARTTSDGGITHTGEILGTPQCMSPEQARGEIVDQRSDLFSLGCVMYTMCTGVSPFRADNMMAVMKKVCEINPRPMAQINPNLPEWLCELVHRLLEKEPERRVKTATEVVEVLESRVVGPQPASTERSRSPSKTPARDVPEWILTPVTPSLTWISQLPGYYADVCVSSLVLGLMHGISHGTAVVETLAIGLAIWFVAAIIRLLSGRGSWITWHLFALSIVSLAAGSLLGVVVRHEVGLKVQGIVFVFGAAITIFWLLTRWFPGLFFQTLRVPAEAAIAPPVETPARTSELKPRSPWRVLAWMFVGILGFGMMVSVGFVVALIVPWIASNSRVNPTLDQATLRVLFPAGEIPQSIRLDGQEMTLPPVPQQGNGTWSVMTEVGPHDLQVIYESAADAEQEKFFHSTLNISGPGRTTVEAVPTLRPRVQQVNPRAALTELAKPGNSPAATASIPLADAVNVLTDVENWPRYPYQIGTGVELKTQVWIDEPGLVIRLKPLDFEGKENGDEQYVASCDWGSGDFKRIGVPLGQAGNLSPGRYRVLVQDLDYGWDLDRRGTIVIGPGQQTIHVKRSFVGQQMNPNDYPVNFRWAGKSYQLTTAEQVAEMNRCVLLRNRLPTIPEASSGFEVKVPWGNPLGEEIENIFPFQKFHLMYIPRRMKLEIPTGLNIQSVTIISDRGELTWGRSVPDGFLLPTGPLKYRVTYDPGFSWPGDHDAKPVVPDVLPNQTLVVGGLTKADMRTTVVGQQHKFDGYGLSFRWFSERYLSVDTDAVPVAERLILAWLDGQPDVPQTELVQLGKSESWEKMWRNVRPDEENMPRVIEPGSTPGTWRMKEPPEGALAPN